MDDQGEPSEAIAGVTQNIGVGGAFIVTDDPLPPGTQLALEIRIPGVASAIPLRAEVRWIADGEEDAVQGMGVKFFDLGVEQMLELNDYFASLPITEPDPD